MESELETEIDSAGSMSFVFYLNSIIPKSELSGELLLHLHGRLSDSLKAVIPNKLGRIKHTPSHAQEYQRIKTHTVKPRPILPMLKQPAQMETILRFNHYNHQRRYSKSPGVVRVHAKNRSMVSRHRHNLSPTFDKSFHSFAEPPLKLASMKVKRQSEDLANRDTIVSFSGDSSSGSKNGKGIAVFVNGDTYKGNWLDDKKHFYGVYKYAEIGAKYKGEWIFDKKHGEGLIKFRNGDILQGRWEEDMLIQNRVTLTYKAGEIYEGELLDCKKEGTGTMHYSESDIYKGEWSRDLREGSGFLRGSSYFFEGIFKNDSTESVGVLVHSKAIIDRANENNVFFRDITMHDAFENLTHFEHFSSMELTSYDIVYMALTVRQLRFIAEVPGNIVITDGRFSAGKLNGAGIAQYGKFGTYIGMFVDGKRSGWGKMTYTDSSYVCLWTYESEGVYLGQWLDDMRQGYGEMTWENGLKYQGNFNKDRRHQVTGKMSFPSGEVYEGGWVEELLEGFGRLNAVSGVEFAGQFSQGKALEKGKLTYRDGKIYKGQISMFEPHGAGKMRFPNKDIYRGNFFRGKFYGVGKIKYANGDTYDGEWENGLRKGRGVFKGKQQVYDGYWENNKRHGIGKLMDRTGEVLYDGQWANDMRDI